jgi:hypothetical protein
MPAIAQTGSVMDLSQHGGACRCLLRLLENEGNAGMSDAAFIARFLPRYPEWRERPGAADLSIVCDVARDLGLAGSVHMFRDYDRVLSEHRAGHGVLVYTERPPEQVASRSEHTYVTLLVNMDEEAFTVWCPYPSGQSDTLPVAARGWWEQWGAIGLTLRRPLR